MALLEVKNISKSFGNLKAVDNASFSVPEGSIFGLLGRNGAGKTTTIRMMMNIYLPDSGEVTFGGILGDSITSLVQTIDGGHALGGPTGSFGAGDSDAWSVRRLNYEF